MSQLLDHVPWGEDAVRGLLRGLRRPHTLHDSPLARALMSAYGVNEPVKAARCLVNDTFAHGGLVGTRLAEIVYRSDFDASIPLVAVAQQMGLSPRHFFRRRAEAISALARHAASVAFQPLAPDRAILHLAGSLSRTDPETSAAIARLGPSLSRADSAIDPSERLLQLCESARTCFGLGDPAAGRRIVTFIERELTDRGLSEHAAIDFEVSYLRYLDSIHSGTVSQSFEFAAGLSRINHVSPEQAGRRYAAQAESAIRSGNGDGALRSLVSLERLTARSDVRGHAILVAASGAIAFIQHDFQTAANCYSAVSLALSRHPVDHWVSEAMIGRTNGLLGRAWRPASPQRCERFESRMAQLSTNERVSIPASSETAPGRIVLEVASLRHAFEFGTTGVTADPHALIEKAGALGYASIEAMAIAALAARSAADGDWTSNRRQLVNAWKKWSTICDATVAVDLFAFRNAGCRTILRQSSEFVRTIDAWMREQHPFHALSKKSPRASQATISKLLLLADVREVGVAGDVSRIYADPVLTAIAMLVEPRYRASLAQRFASELNER